MLQEKLANYIIAGWFNLLIIALKYNRISEELEMVV